MDSANFSDFVRGAGQNRDDRWHVKALRYSLYNAATIIIAGIICGALISVYFVLEVFVQPLVWAILIGCVLFPIKMKFAQWGKDWLSGLKESETPFTLGLVLLPLKMIDSISEQLWTQFFSYWKTLLIFLLIAALLFILSSVELLYPVTFVLKVCGVLYEILGFFRAEWVWTSALVYLVTVVFFRDWFQSVCPQIRLSNVAVFIWISLIFHVSTWLGIFRLPICLCLFAAFVVGSWNTFKQWIYPDPETEVDSSSSPGKTKDKLEDLVEGEEDEEEEEEKKEKNNPGAMRMETVGATITTTTTAAAAAAPTPKGDSSSTPSRRAAFLASSKSRSHTEVGHRRMTTTASPLRSRSFSIADAIESIKEVTPFADVLMRRQRGLDAMELATRTHNAADRVFLWLFIACLIVYVFHHPAILRLLAVPTMYVFLKRGSYYLWRRYRPMSYLNDSLRELIFPNSIRTLWSAVCLGDQKISVLIEATISKVTTIILLLLLLVFTILFCVIIFAQVQRESVQLVWTGANLINETVARNPEIAKWLPQADAMQTTVVSAIDKGYEHGREWLAKKVSGFITGTADDEKNRLKVEKELLQVIDQLYRSWHTNHTDTSGGLAQLCKLGLTSCPSAAPAFVDPKSDPGGTQDSSTQTEPERGTSFTQMWKFLVGAAKSEWLTEQLKDMLDLNRAMEIFRDNIGSVMGILESLWLIIRSNVHSVFNFVTAMLSLLFGGGTAILNFFVSTVVFLTTLFYLLSISEKDYKPLGWLTTFAGPVVPTGEFEAAISSVLLATLKMAVFYGLYTWLTHTVFGANIVFIPSAMAAIFAAIPFLGTYWAALPALIELWVLKGDLLRALLLLLAHLLPTYVVDMLIYGDIRDGGHPYLTGLAIVGGIYFLGLQGAIIGPILLCFLIVVFNVYRTMLSAESAGDQTSLRQPARPEADLPNVFLHQSTPVDPDAAHGPIPIRISPASTPESAFPSGGGAVNPLLPRAIFGSQRARRSNSVPNVAEDT